MNAQLPSQRPADWFEDPPPTAHVRSARPWPVISGSEQRLSKAIDHFLSVAESQNVRVQYTDDKNFTTIGEYQPRDRSITLHADLRHTPGLYAFVLAHELAHALDPLLPPPPVYGKKLADREVVAEASAIEALKAWGMTLTNEHRYLDWTDKLRMFSLSFRWRRATTSGWSSLLDRLTVTRVPLLPAPADQNTRAEIERNYKKALRRANRAARREARSRR